MFDPEIYARSKLLIGLIGSGIRRSLAPVLQEAEAEHHGLHLHYQIIDTAERADPQVLPALLSAAKTMGFAGLNITFPFKQAVLPLLDAVSEDARAMNAVNCVTIQSGRLMGHNTDGAGWAWGFQRNLPQADLSRVVLLGCGGAGSAVAHAALGLGVEQMVLVDFDAAKAQALCESLRSRFGARRIQTEPDIARALEGASGLIHATPVGMLKQPGMALSADLLRPQMWVSDLVYVPMQTALLQAAQAVGCATLDGGHMNVGQGFLNFKLFTGLEPDVARMDAHFRHLVHSHPGDVKFIANRPVASELAA